MARPSSTSEPRGPSTKSLPLVSNSSTLAREQPSEQKGASKLFDDLPCLSCALS
jgi:hypothetical protein